MKKFFKRLALGAAIILTSPAWLLARIGCLAGSQNLFNFIAQGLSLVPGLPGNYLRLGFYLLTLTHISSDITIEFGSFFSKTDAVVGKKVNIGAYCIIGKATLGDEVLVASRVSIISGKYQHGSSMDSNSGNEPRFDRVTIGSRTWIGEGAIIGADVGADCLIGAGSVVMRSVPDGYLVSGNPMKCMKRPSTIGDAS